MVRVSEALLERETLDGGEVKTLLNGGDLPPFTSTRPPRDSGGDTQQVIRPDVSGGLRIPGLGEGPQLA